MPRLQTASVLLLGIALGAVGVSLAPRSVADAPPPLPREDPFFRTLDANLYQQASAEYRACCHQAFNLAARRLEEKMSAPRAPLNGAVILDLDETVLDNSGFQAMLARSGLNFDMRLWDDWQANHAADVELVPGAKEFIAFAQKRKVAVCYITNRDEKFRAGCKAALERHGLGVPDDQLLLATTTTDKTERRAKFAERYSVLLLVGDNLRDFDEAFKYPRGVERLPPAETTAAVAARAKIVDDQRAKFGTDWIVLPNPMYGEWMKPFGRGPADLDFLRPTRKPKE